MIAGLAARPSRFSPLTNLERRARAAIRCWRRWSRAGYLTDDEANRWRARPVVVRQPPDFFRKTSPYFTEHVRRDIAALRREDAARGRAGDRDDGDAVDRRAGAGERRLLAAQAGQAAGLARSGGAPRGRRRATSSAAASPPATARAAGRGAALPGAGRVGDCRTGAARVRVGKGIYTLPLASDGLGGAVQHQATRPTASCSTSTVGVLRAGDVIWVKNAHQSQRRRFSDWTYDAKSEVQWLPAYDETTKPPPRRAQLRARADAARAGDDLQLRPRHRLRRGDGGRRRLRPLGVQPRRRRRAGSRARPTSRCTTRSRSTEATASRRCSTTCRAPRSIRSPARCGPRPTSTTPSSTRCRWSTR